MENSKLQVWWIPQVPMKAFKVPVSSLEEAALIIKTLADYDIFQFENHVKPEYCNSGGLEEWNEVEGEWYEWEDEETGDNFGTYWENQLAMKGDQSK